MGERGLAIAIDGPSAAGKGTVAQGVARSLGYQYIDTGAMYRAVALFAERAGVPWTDGERVAAVAERLRFHFAWDGGALRIFVDDEDVSETIRTAHIGRGASDVSTHPPVRRALLERQQALGARGGVVMDGRDIGTVVLPEAELKIYLDADLGERARRRASELRDRGQPAEVESVRAAIADRDRQDRERITAPLRKADDAVLVDTTDLSIPEAVARVVDLANERLQKHATES